MKSEKKILILSDLDGTYVDHNSRPLARNEAAVARLKAAGGYFSLATGRNERSLREMIGDFTALINAPAILVNGGYLFDPASGEKLCPRLLDGRETYAMLREIHARFPQNRVRYTDNSAVHYLFEGFEPQDFAWYKVVFEGRPEEVAAIRQAVYALCGDRYAYSFSSPTLFEMLRAGATKGAMVQVLRRIFAERGETLFLYACGDYENDFDLLRAADLPVCPANAHPDVLAYVRAAGGWVVCDNDTGVIADVVERIGL